MVVPIVISLYFVVVETFIVPNVLTFVYCYFDITMAAGRKLQNEIDRTLKKVDEGVKLFQDLWEKVQTAPNPNQKEKFESELKKEIKKLQRLRDQIKTWITSGDIKDKKSLLEARKVIEAQMERFKVVEKETKTKAYSKEGLGSVQKMDPMQREREDLIMWLSNNIDSLKVHTDTCESELEVLQVASKKKKLEKEKQERVDRLKYSLERHSHHIGRLEAIMRLLDNEAIDIDQVKKIKDDVDYYVQSNGEPDFKENEEMYDDLDIDETVIPDAASVGGMASTNTDDGDELGSPLALTSSGGLGGSLANNIGGTGTTNSQTPPSSTSNSPSPTPSLSTGLPSAGGSGHQQIQQSNSLSKVGRTASTSSASNPNRHNSGGSSSGSASAGANNNNNNNTNSNSQPSGSRPQMSITPLKQSINDGHYSSNTGVPERASSVGPLPPPLVGSSLLSSLSSSDQNSSSSYHNHNNHNSNNANNNSSGSGAQPFPFNFAAVAASGPSLSNGPSSSTRHNNNNNNNNNDIASSIGAALSSSSVDHSPHSITSSQTSSSLMTSPSEGFSAVSRQQQQQDQQDSILKSGGSSAGGLLTTAIDLNSGSLLSSTTNPSVSFAFKASQSVFGAPQQTSAGNPSSSSTTTTNTSGRTSQSASATGTPSQQPQQQQQQATPTSNSLPATAPMSSSSTSTSAAAAAAAAASSSQQQAAAILAAVTSHYGHSLPSGWNDSAPNSGSSSVANSSSVVSSLLPQSSQNSMRSARISARQGISPLGKVQLRPDQVWQRKMVEAALGRVPMLGDAERVRHYLPRQPCTGPNYYPSAAIDGCSSLEFYKRLNVDSLFFVFYFMEGTKAQLLAAQALKDLAWRFHTRELTWFQRAETPKEVTESYEMGTYLYFDTQRWQTRKRENFRFEYQFLEDRNLNSYLEAAEATAQAAIAANSAAAAAALMMAAAASNAGASSSSSGGISSSGQSSSSALTGTGPSSVNSSVQQAGQQAVAAGGRK